MNTEIYKQIKSVWDGIAKPIDGLGRIEDIICRIGAVQGDLSCDIKKRALIIMCADNGIVEEGVSQCGSYVTREVASWMGAKKSSVSHLAGAVGIDTLAVDVGIKGSSTPEGVLPYKVCNGTKNFLKEPAMTGEQCKKAIAVGKDMAKQCKKDGYTILALGEAGIGNTTTSAALIAILLGLEAEKVCGRGAGLSEEGLKKKRFVVNEAKRLYRSLMEPGKKPDEKKTFEALCAVGGADIAALTGICIAAVDEGLPVVLDGIITAAAALCACLIRPDAADCLIASHMGREKGMAYVFSELSLKPVIDAELAIGEGCGAVLLFPLLDAALSLYRGGIRFADSAVEQYKRL